MSNQVINVDGEERVVREDTAKKVRGVNWAIASIIGFVVIAAVIAGILLIGATTDGKIESPATNTNAVR